MQVDFEGLYEQKHLNLLEEEEVNFIIKENKLDTNKISDGYHTFEELYEFRKVYNAALFNEWAANEKTYTSYDEEGDREMLRTYNSPKYYVHKSWRHFDGELCFGGGWFVVVAVLPTGQITNHYEAKDWDLFNIPAYDKALYEFDGHTSSDVIERIKNI